MVVLSCFQRQFFGPICGSSQKTLRFLPRNRGRRQ